MFTTTNYSTLRTSQNEIRVQIVVYIYMMKMNYHLFLGSSSYSRGIRQSNPVFAVRSFIQFHNLRIPLFDLAIVHLFCDNKFFYYFCCIASSSWIPSGYVNVFERVELKQRLFGMKCWEGIFSFTARCNYSRQCFLAGKVGDSKVSWEYGKLQQCTRSTKWDILLGLASAEAAYLSTRPGQRYVYIKQ
uniref:Transmembrane protein n=1 Tax=Heterorhabditis bacteriophora TaxID=37862 RepID=A0A1I7WEL4_HETBA